MKRAADTIETHREGILNYFMHRICQRHSSRPAACGFRNFANYRARILFFLGALNLAPSPSH